jgi:CMP-N,N'-diacetyllegionaminic acid synthase
MTYSGHSVLAVIPARGGSKSIPRKNLKIIGGNSLIGHAAKICERLDWIDVAIISTDDEEIAEEAVRNGLEQLFLRPPELAGDTASSVDTWRHALLASEKHFGHPFDLTILLEPTSPLRTPKDVERTVAEVASGKFQAAATVSATSPSHTPHKTLVRSDDGHLGFFLDGGGQYSIRQRIPKYYHRNGICYALHRRALLDPENLYIVDRDCSAIVIDRPLVNIDEPFDLELAEWLMGRQSQKSPSE